VSPFLLNPAIGNDQKRIGDSHAVVILAVVHVLAEHFVTAFVLGCSDDERVPIAKLKAFVQIDGLFHERWRNCCHMRTGQGPQCCASVGKRAQWPAHDRGVEELAENLRGVEMTPVVVAAAFNSSERATACFVGSESS